MRPTIVRFSMSAVVLVGFVTPSIAGWNPWSKKSAPDEKGAIQQVEYTAQEPNRFEATAARPIVATPLNYTQPHSGAPNGHVPVQPAGFGHRHYPLAPVPTVPGPGAVVNAGQYPYLDAPLYPCPVPHVPTYVGGTYITNQAFAPHEMLYPHEYHAMYGPYFWRTKGTYVLTPFGVRSHEKWQLQGTQVNVKYHSHKPFFAGLASPRGFHEHFYDGFNGGVHD